MENQFAGQEKNHDKEPATHAVTEQVVIDQEKLHFYRQHLKREQNFPRAIFTGLISSVLCASLWAFITYSTGYQIGYMAIALGFVVGYSVRYGGKGLDQVYGLLGAFFAFLGCLLGNLLSVVAIAAKDVEIDFMSMLFNIDPERIPELMSLTFSFVDLLFYGVAIYEGYRFAFRHITREEMISHAAE